jgi:hypothetical protein
MHACRLSCTHLRTLCNVHGLCSSALGHEDVWGSGGIDPHIVDLGIGWRWVVSFTPLLLYPRGKSPLVPSDRRLGGPRAGLDDVEKRKFLTVPGLELRPLGLPTHSAVAIPTALSQLLQYNMENQKSALSHFHPKVEIEHSNIQENIWRYGGTVPHILKLRRPWLL